MDTDAAGIWHHSTATRWTEEAEAELHRRLGVITETFGATPRVHIEYDFSLALRFDDEVEVRLTVVRVGESSVEYAIQITRDGADAATGHLVAVLIDRETQRRRSWPDHLRKALESTSDDPKSTPLIHPD